MHASNSNIQLKRKFSDSDIMKLPTLPFLYPEEDLTEESELTLVPSMQQIIANNRNRTHLTKLRSIKLKTFSRRVIRGVL